MTGSPVERWERTKALFGDCLDAAPDARAALLVERCGDDDALRAEVESLLAAHVPEASFLERSAFAAAATALAEDGRARIGERVGA